MPKRTRTVRHCTFAVLLILGAAAPAFAQSAAVLYERAQSRGQALVKLKAPAVADLRSAARAYENIVRRYPSSGYSDNALWEAAALQQLAFDRGRQQSDLERAVELLKWLRREYPSSSLVAQAKTRLAQIEPAPEPRPAAVPTPPAVSSQPLAPPPQPAAPPGPDKESPGPGAAIRNISVAALPRGERVTIEVSREVTISGDRVASPDRVFFDFPNASVAAAVVDRVQALNGRLLGGIRVGTPSNGTTRVVLELNGAPRHSAFPLYDPFRLVIDLETDAALPPPNTPTTPAPPPAPAARDDEAPGPPTIRKPEPPAAAPARTPPSASSPAPASSTRDGDYSLARQLGLGVSRIVIDPGHGGHDPGAIGNNVREAELVLDVALRLEALLKQKAGFEVMLTRRTNEFIPLEERTAIANREHADLFLSIHANAGRNTQARGVETYYLNFATNPQAEAVAARENATSAQTMGTLPAILRAIALNNKLAESRELATILQTSMVRRLRAQSSGVRDLGVKQAPFVVLIGAQMPSVLAEISFVTNRAEAALLKQSSYRQHIAQALAEAIVKYQGSLKKITTEPAAPAAR